MPSAYAEFEQFAVNPRRTPEWVLATHGPDQITNVFRHGGVPGLATANFPGPKQAERLPVPSDDRRGLDDEEAGPPVVPDATQPSP